MEPTEDELAAHFAAMEDEVLLETALNRNELTEHAQNALVSEVKSRRLTLPRASAVLLHDEEIDSHAVWVTIDRFRDLSVAIVARSALEAAAIPCFLRDENTVRMDWQISNFIGGMRLQVLEQDRDAAEAMLRGLTIEDEDSSGFGIATDAPALDRCPECESTDIYRTQKHRGFSLAALFLFSLPVPRGRKVWKCAKCGAQWDDGGDPD